MHFIKGKVARYLNDLKGLIVKERRPVKKFRYKEGDIPGGHKKNCPEGDWGFIQPGDTWGGYDKIVWFRRKVCIPSGWNIAQPAFDFCLDRKHRESSEEAGALLFIDEQPYQGLDSRHQRVLLPRDMAGKTILVAIKAFSGLDKGKSGFKRASLICIDKTVRDFYYRAKTTLETVSLLTEGEKGYQFLLNSLAGAINILDFRKPESGSFYTSVKEANRYLEERLAEYNSGKETGPLVYAVGHAHIDVAWLWRLKHTKEKCARTFSSVLRLMEEYPEFKFVQSSPQLYRFIKEDYPEIFSRIRKKVKEGRWEVTGGMWVEADTNIPDGESLVRQLLFGTRFIREEFNRECRLVWLPDVFGFSWALPQIIKKSGLKYLMTTKISWNEFTRQEKDTFMWRGPDGSELLTHFITTPDVNDNTLYTYNGVLEPDSVRGLWDNYGQKEINDRLLLSFGWGDGGGGPTRKMLEKGKKMQELPTLPRVKFSRAEPYFEELSAGIEGDSRLPVWDDELYLEYHRGTYTSQGRTKRNNRKAEVLLHNLECVCSLVDCLLADYEYPRGEINNLWPTLLRNQFHDILPGSSIKEVYEDSEEEFHNLFKEGEKLLDESLTNLLKAVEGEGEKLLVFNPLPWVRSGYITLPRIKRYSDKIFSTGTGEQLFKKRVPGSEEILLRVPEIPPMGYRTFKIVPADEAVDISSFRTRGRIRINDNQIENQYYQIKLNGNGQIISLYDKKADLEVIPKNNKANVFQVFEDRPRAYNAWNIDIYYRDKVYTVDNLVEREIIERGPGRGVIRFVWEFLDSSITQFLTVYAEKRRIDFRTEVDWHQQQLLLKTAFPVDIRSREATYEIQFGNIKRPTHRNTTRDLAKFEVPAQKWADLSRRDYGVSLLNDCKYGYDIRDNIMRLTLIKSGIEPDPRADQGYHEFTYSLYPHQKDWYHGGTTKEGYEFNYPLLAFTGKGGRGKLSTRKSPVKIEARSVILRTIKRAEDDRSLILRFYEYGNRRDRVEVKLLSVIKSVKECNLMEKELGAIDYQGCKFQFKINPHEIKTFKVQV